MKIINLIIVLVLLPYYLFSQIISTIAGTGLSTFSGEGVFATLANTPNPGGCIFDKKGNFYFADGQNSHRVRMISPSGIIITVAGNGISGYMGDGGPATNARLNGPSSVAIDTSGNLYIADVQNLRIRRVDAITGIITTIAGNGTGGYYGEGIPATDAMIWGVPNLCIDRQNNIYIADAQNARVRKINSSGIISTYAGNGTHGHTGDGATALSAEIAWPTSVALDDSGNLYVTCNSSFSNRVRKINTLGIISTIVGNGNDTYIGDGIPATDAQLAPNGITVDNTNNLYISDRFNNRVYKVDVLTGMFYNIAGTGLVGDSGDGGAATVATLNYPVGLATDACNNLYFTTVGSVSVPGSGRRIRKVTFNPPTTPTITLSGITTATVGATVTVNATVSGAGSSYTIRWFRNSSLFSTTTTPTTTFVKGIGIDTITARIVPTIVYCYDSTMAAPHSVLEAPVAIGSVPERQQYSVYPNPAQQQLNISSPAAVHTITISSPVGQQWLAYTGSSSTEVQLSVAHLPPGLYIVRVNNSYSTKMIKE